MTNYTGGKKPLLIDLMTKYRLVMENKHTDACCLLYTSDAADE